MTWTVLLELVMESDANGDGTIDLGGFQLLDLIITELKSHMTGYNLMPLIGWNYSIQTGEQILLRIFFDK